MRESQQIIIQRGAKKAQHGFVCVLASLILIQVAPQNSHAESLFHASTSYKSREPMTSRSLFTPPIPRQVGDIVTIVVDEEAISQDLSELKINRARNSNNTGGSAYNNLLGFFLDKLPFTGKLNNFLEGPTINDSTNQNALTSKAENIRNTRFRDRITCQVVQILPNGDLVIQGQKTMQLNKERQDMMLTGIVRPYYVDRNNEISSRQVAGLQLIRGGKGVISRQQNDTITDKVYQFFN